MGIKNLPLKKIVGILFIIAAIITVATNLKFVWNCLKSLANPIVRDVILYALFVGLLIWLILINRKLKKLPKTGEEDLRPEIKKEVQEIEWNLRHEYVLKKIAEGQRGYTSLYKLYEKEFSDASGLEFKVIMEDLNEADLIRFSHMMFNDEYYEATREGRKIAVKGLLEEMEMRRLASKF